MDLTRGGVRTGVKRREDQLVQQQIQLRNHGNLPASTDYRCFVRFSAEDEDTGDL